MALSYEDKRAGTANRQINYCMTSNTTALWFLSARCLLFSLLCGRRGGDAGQGDCPTPLRGGGGEFNIWNTWFLRLGSAAGFIPLLVDLIVDLTITVLSRDGWYKWASTDNKDFFLKPQKHQHKVSFSVGGLFETFVESSTIAPPEVWVKYRYRCNKH